MTIFPYQPRKSIVLSTYQQSFQPNGCTRCTNSKRHTLNQKRTDIVKSVQSKRKQPSLWFQTNISSQLQQILHTELLSLVSSWKMKKYCTWERDTEFIWINPECENREWILLPKSTKNCRIHRTNRSCTPLNFLLLYLVYKQKPKWA